MGVGKRGGGGVARDAGCGEQGVDGGAEPLDDLLLAADDLRQVGSDILRCAPDAKGFGFAERGGDFGAATKRLGGDAALVETGSAGVASLHDGYLKSGTGGTDGSLVTAGSAAYDNEVVGNRWCHFLRGLFSFFCYCKTAAAGIIGSSATVLFCFRGMI